DKRFLPYLGRSGSIWGQSKMVARETPGDNLRVERTGILYPENDPDPLGSQQRIVLDISNRNDPALHLADLANNKIRWTHRLQMVPVNGVNINYNFFNFFEQQLINFRPQTRFRFCMTKGHLAVVQVGSHVYAIDMDNPRLLWQQNLLDA